MVELQRSILAQIDAEKDELVRLVSDLVKVPSLPGQEKDVAFFLAKRARAMGFDPEMLELRDTDIPAPGRPGLLWTLKGSGEGYTLMFNGHLDTEPVSPAYADSAEDPFSGRIADGRIYGIGTMNMKAGVAAYIYAAKAIKDAGVPLKGNILVTAVPAELNGGAGTRYFLECGIVPDLAINAEASQLTVTVASAGVVNVRLVLKGYPTHIAFPEKGRSVIPQLAHVIEGLTSLKISYDENLYRGFLEPKLNVGYVNGGYEYRAGLFMDRCTLVINVRGPVGVTPATVKRDFETWVAQLKAADPGLDIEVSVLNPVPRYMPPFHVSTEEYVVQAMARAHEVVTGKTPQYTATLAGLDTGNLQYWRNVPSVVYGPAGASGSFTPPEYVEIEEVVIAAKAYALAALDIATKTREEIGDRYRVPVRAPKRG